MLAKGARSGAGRHPDIAGRQVSNPIRRRSSGNFCDESPSLCWVSSRWSNGNLGGDGLGAALGKAALGQLLRAFGLVVLLSLSNSPVLLAQNELDVAGAGHVGVSATVRTVRPPALLLGAVDLQVEDLEVLGVETFDLHERAYAVRRGGMRGQNRQARLTAGDVQNVGWKGKDKRERKRRD